MSERAPFFLREAVVTLYAQGSDGTLQSDAPVWAGGLVNGFRAHSTLDEVTLAGSGESYRTTHHVDEEHVLELGRTWLIRTGSSLDYRPPRNQQLVLDLVWQTAGSWYRRTYYGVTARSATLDSLGTNQFLTQQVFRAQRYTEEGGLGSAVTTPLEGVGGQSIPFFREGDDLATGVYLLGHYRFATGVVLQSVRAIGWNSLVAPTVLTLEVGGVLVPVTVTLPVGDPDAEVTAEASLGGVAVPAGTSVRWRVTQSPGAGLAPTAVALVVWGVPQ